MYKTLFLLTFLFLNTCLFAQKDPELVHIPAQVFLHNVKTNFQPILYTDSTLKAKVAFLHAHNELRHDLSVRTNNFDEYWDVFKNSWHFIKMRKDTAALLLFTGLKNYYDERGYVQLFDLSKKQMQQCVFSSVGNLLAYKIQPNTGGIVLYVHEYPCCHSASHNIKILRQLNGKIQVRKRFFVGRDKGDMVGPFFPKTAMYDSIYHTLTKKTALRWSPAVVNHDAFSPWSNSNLIIHYEKGAIYKVLGKQDGWLFVLMLSGISHEQARVINYTNFEFTGVYGWIKEK